MKHRFRHLAILAALVVACGLVFSVAASAAPWSDYGFGDPQSCVNNYGDVGPCFDSYDQCEADLAAYGYDSSQCGDDSINEWLNGETEGEGEVSSPQPPDCWSFGGLSSVGTVLVGFVTIDCQNGGENPVALEGMHYIIQLWTGSYWADMDVEVVPSRYGPGEYTVPVWFDASSWGTGRLWRVITRGTGTAIDGQSTLTGWYITNSVFTIDLGW